MADTTENEITGTEDAIDLSEEQDGGLLKQIKREGSGDDQPLTGDTVYVHYVGTLLDGTKFDSSRDRGERFEFKIGKGQVIKGWDVGVASMKRGELAVLTCSSKYAYGEAGSPPKIPANATLQFEVELFDWKGEDVSNDKDGSVLKSTLTAGSGWETPNDRATLTCHVTGRHGDRVFEDRDVTVVMGEGEDVGIVPGLEAAIRKCKTGETARVWVKASQAYGAAGHAEYDIPPHADLVYTLTINSFEKAKEAWEMDAGEKLQQAQLVKDKGTKFFKDGKYRIALNYYTKIVDFLDSEDGLEGEEKEKRDALVLAGHLNKAMCFLKLEDNLEAIHSCDAALKHDEANEKARFRKATARMNMKDWTEAIKCFEAVLEVSPGNKAAGSQIRAAKQRIREDEAHDRKLYNNMFAKFAQIDSQKEEAQKAKNGDPMQQVGDWDNKLADGMLPLEKEAEAFGETTPEPKYKQAEGAKSEDAAES